MFTYIFELTNQFGDFRHSTQILLVGTFVSQNIWSFYCQHLKYFFFILLAGIIYTADILDRETTQSYWLTVYATDRGVVPLYTTIEVYIEVEDVNDNAPLTSEPIYYPSVLENSPKDVSVIQIQAVDPDSNMNEKLSYRITSGNPQNFFIINPKTGNEFILHTLGKRL